MPSAASPVVRPAAAGDAPAIADAYAHYVMHTAVTFELEAPSADEWHRRLLHAAADGYPWWVVDVAGEVAGWTGSGPFRDRPAYRPTAEVSVYLRPGMERRGLGRLLYGTALPGLRAAGFHSALAAIALPNERSVALHEAMGFAHAGTFDEVGRKLDRWWSVGWWQRAL